MDIKRNKLAETKKMKKKQKQKPWCFFMELKEQSKSLPAKWNRNTCVSVSTFKCCPKPLAIMCHNNSVCRFIWTWQYMSWCLIRSSVCRLRSVDQLTQHLVKIVTLQTYNYVDSSASMRHWSKHQPKVPNITCGIIWSVDQVSQILASRRLNSWTLIFFFLNTATIKRLI